MKTLALSVLIVGSIAATAVLAAAPAGAPSGTMGMCNDGTYSSSAEKKGACRGHKGVKEWYGEEGPAAAAKAAAKTTTSTTTTTGAAAAPMTPATPATPSTMSTTRKTSTTSVGNPSGRVAAQAGGGPGQVWANENTKVYHCSGDKWYGKTIHPHPTLGESIGMAAEAFEGVCTDLPPVKKR